MCSLKVNEALRTAEQKLVEISTTPRLDAEVLLAHRLARNRAWLRAFGEYQLTEKESLSFSLMVQRRAEGEPIAYLVGMQEFWSLPLKVSAATLIPRPETEMLVETVLQYAPAQTSAVLDLGTGTGAIGLALKSERHHWHLTGVDCQEGAVSLAQENALQLDLPMECLISHWFAAVPGRYFDVIVANPPYIDEQDMHLQTIGVRFEPRSALVAGRQGLGDIEDIIAMAPQYLTPGALLAFEHGYSQGGEVFSRLIDAGFQNVQTLQDMAGLDRVTFGHWKLPKELPE